MEDEAEETQQSTVDNYTGVSIKVRLCRLDSRVLFIQISGVLQFQGWWRPSDTAIVGRSEIPRCTGYWFVKVII